MNATQSFGFTGNFSCVILRSYMLHTSFAFTADDEAAGKKVIADRLWYGVGLSGQKGFVYFYLPR